MSTPVLCQDTSSQPMSSASRIIRLGGLAWVGGLDRVGEAASRVQASTWRACKYRVMAFIQGPKITHKRQQTKLNKETWLCQN